MSSNTVVELKGGMYTLMSLRLHSSDLALIDAGLADKVQQAPGFFSETPVVLDLSEIDSSSLDADELLAKVREHKLAPVMASVSDKDAALSKAIKLPLIESSTRRSSNKPAGDEPCNSSGNPTGDTPDNEASKGEQAGSDSTPEHSLLQGSKDRTLNSNTESNIESNTGAASEAVSITKNSNAAKHVDYVPPTPLLVTRPVRSGQQVYARDTDLIIMAHVGPGAEIVADNNIHVYGPLRGRALCGVTGNTQSRIFCQSLEAELVSVAGNYKVLEEIPEELRGKPAQIWLQEGRLHIEAL